MSRYFIDRVLEEGVIIKSDEDKRNVYLMNSFDNFALALHAAEDLRQKEVLRLRERLEALTNLEYTICPCIPPKKKRSMS